MRITHRVAKNTGILYARIAITVFIFLDNREMFMFKRIVC
jgi:hypothetical protein